MLIKLACHKLSTYIVICSSTTIRKHRSIAKKSIKNLKGTLKDISLVFLKGRRDKQYLG